MSKEGITQRGVGVEYKKNVSTRNDGIKAGDKMSNMSETKASFNKACGDTKKA